MSNALQSHKERYLQAAKNAERFIEQNLCNGLQLFTSWLDGKRSEKSFLDDYAFYIASLIELYNSTLDKSYLEKAERFCDEAVRRFADCQSDGFYLCETDHTELFMNPKEAYDGAIPSGNSVMAYNFVRLYQLTDEEKYCTIAEKQLEFLAAQAQEYTAGHSMFLLAKLLYENPPEHIVIAVKHDSDLKGIQEQLPFLANVWKSICQEIFLHFPRTDLCHCIYTMFFSTLYKSRVLFLSITEKCKDSY